MMQFFLLTLVTLGLGMVTITPAEACWLPQFAIHSDRGTVEEASAGTVIQVLSGRAMVVGEGPQAEVPVIELTVIEGSDAIKTGSIIRLVVPDGSTACGLLAHDSAILDDGRIKGFVTVSEVGQSGLFVTRFESKRNLQLVLENEGRGEWRQVKWSQGE